MLTITSVFFIGGDDDYSNQPAWAKDGSFMVFRRLRQLVPEFTRYAATSYIKEKADLTIC